MSDTDNSHFDRPKRVLAILGMHRSGTSCLTGSLQKAGLFLGKHQTQNKHNQRGNRENQEVLKLHKALLNYNDGKWHQPPKVSEWSKEHILRAKEILKEYSNAGIWGFKDPRSLFFIEGWQNLIPDIEFIGIYRHPLAVAKSLYERNEFSKELAFNLWHYHNSILIKLHQQNPFPILSFDNNEDEFHESLSALQDCLGLGSVPIKEDRFFTSSLRTKNQFKGQKLPKKIHELYQQLRDIQF